MIGRLVKYLKNKKSRKEAFIINGSSIRSKPSEVFVLRQGLLYVLDDKIVHLTFDRDGVELGHSSLEKMVTLLAHVVIIGCFLFVPIYAFAKGAWYLGVPYSLFAIPASILLISRLRSSATPMILKHEVVCVQIKHAFLGIFLPYLQIVVLENETFQIALGNGLFFRKSKKLRLENILKLKGYF